MKNDTIKFLINSKQKFCVNYNNIENKYFTKPSIRKTTFVFSIVFFAIAMYILNCLTPLLVDDYAWGYINGTQIILKM